MQNCLYERKKMFTHVILWNIPHYYGKLFRIFSPFEYEKIISSGPGLNGAIN